MKEGPELPDCLSATDKTTISVNIHPNKKEKMKHKNLITVVTDHQLTADTIAAAIGANEKHDGYYLGNGYAVTWTNGELIEATFSPRESFVLSTDMDCRLVYAHNFKFAMRDYDHLVGYNKTEEDARQLETIRQLWRMSGVVVNAMAPDIQGDLTFLSLYYFLAGPVSVRRAWLPVLRKQPIIKAVANGPRDSKRYEKWLSESIFNHLIDLADADADKAGAPVVEETDVEQVNRESAAYGIESDAKAGEIYADEKYLGILIDGKPLYSHIGLLVDAAVELDFDHKTTTATALRLYSKQLISYPLTAQNTVPACICGRMRRNLKVLAHNSRWGHLIKKGRPSQRHNYRHGENTYNGFGIITTGLHPVALSADEEKLYNLIVKRVIEAFAPDGPETARRKKGSRRSRKSKVKNA